MTHHFDHGIVGAGIVGLAHAYALARRGQSVVVFERNERVLGASVRNFGTIWPIGQTGVLYALALQSRDIWLEVLERSGIWHCKNGSLHIAHKVDEAQVLEEFAREAPAAGYECELWSASEVTGNVPAVNSEGLQAGLWSSTEIGVDPREVMSRLPTWLRDQYGVEFHFNTTVTGYDRPNVFAGDLTLQADYLWVCTGDDLQTLYPSFYRELGLRHCKLQMMRSQPLEPGSIGPLLASGLTLRHYASFGDCPTLPALKERVATEMPDYDRFGIHVLIAQNGRGELSLGDSHEYDDDIDPFDKPEIDRLILNYVEQLLTIPELRIVSRWNGTYCKHPSKPYVVDSPEPGATVVSGAGGAGLTLSFGLAEENVRRLQTT